MNESKVVVAPRRPLSPEDIRRLAWASCLAPIFFFSILLLVLTDPYRFEDDRYGAIVGLVAPAWLIGEICCFRAWRLRRWLAGQASPPRPGNRKLLIPTFPALASLLLLLWPDFWLLLLIGTIISPVGWLGIALTLGRAIDEKRHLDP